MVYFFRQRLAIDPASTVNASDILDPGFPLTLDIPNIGAGGGSSMLSWPPPTIEHRNRKSHALYEA